MDYHLNLPVGWLCRLQLLQLLLESLAWLHHLLYCIHNIGNSKEDEDEENDSDPVKDKACKSVWCLDIPA